MASNNNEWRIMDTYFKSHRYPFTGHHLDSYREFIKNQIPGIIKSYNPITMTKYNDDKEEIFKIEIFLTIYIINHKINIAQMKTTR